MKNLKGNRWQQENYNHHRENQQLKKGFCCEGTYTYNRHTEKGPLQSRVRPWEDKKSSLFLGAWDFKSLKSIPSLI